MIIEGSLCVCSSLLSISQFIFVLQKQKKTKKNLANQSIYCFTDFNPVSRIMINNRAFSSRYCSFIYLFLSFLFSFYLFIFLLYVRSIEIFFVALLVNSFSTIYFI